MSEVDWVTVEQTPLEAVAEMMRARLEVEGVEAVLRGNRASSAAGVVNELNLSWSNPLGGVEVRVHRADAQRAREILAVDERPIQEQLERRETPFWIQLLGALAAGNFGYYLGFALTDNATTGAVCALIGFGAALALARRIGGRR